MSASRDRLGCLGRLGRLRRRTAGAHRALCARHKRI